MTRRRFIVTAAILTAVIAAIPFVCNEKLTASYYDISAPNLTAPVKIAFLSDVHNTLYGSGMSELIGMVDDMLFVIYTNRDEKIRLISAREATEQERRRYYGNRILLLAEECSIDSGGEG